MRKAAPFLAGPTGSAARHVAVTGGSPRQTPPFPFGDVLGRTFDTAFSRPVLGSRLLAQTLLMALAYALLTAAVGRFFDFTASAIYLTLSGVPYTFIFAPLAVSLHRLVLLGEPLPASLLSVPRAKDYALLGLMLYIPLLVLQYFAQVSINAGDKGLVLALSLSLFVASVLAMRLFVALPYFALDEPHPVLTAWRHTAGHWWQVTGLTLVLGAATLAAVIFLGAALVLLLNLIVGENPLVLAFALQLFLVAVMTFVVVLTVAMLTQIVLAVDPRAPRPPSG